VAEGFDLIQFFSIVVVVIYLVSCGFAIIVINKNMDNAINWTFNLGLPFYAKFLRGTPETTLNLFFFVV
jgi:hypothetical protein